MIYTRTLISTATWQRRCIHSVPSFSSTTNNVLMCNTQTQSFATQKKKKKKPNKGGNNKPQDVYKQQIKAQQQSSIIGKRPGQTTFSPPTEKIVLEASISTTPLQSSTPNKTKSTSANIKHTHMPLIIPPSIQSSIDNNNHQPLSSSSSSSSYTDNKNVAHTQPSISKYTQELIDKEDNILRQQFLREGILPPPDRPNITKSSSADQSTNITPVEIPEAHPSGVSHANPEDILDMASMYDPSIHLPDKPNFNSPTNRIKYEAGTPLIDELIAYIGVRGPITVAEYMRRVLRDGRYGYYTNKGSRSGQKMKNDGSVASVRAVGSDSVEDDIDDDNDWDLEDSIGDSSSSDEHVGGGEQVIGPSGDFITAPEVSQLFGESLLVWLMTQYQTLNSPSKIQIIEIGPGKSAFVLLYRVYSCA